MVLPCAESVLPLNSRSRGSAKMTGTLHFLEARFAESQTRSRWGTLAPIDDGHLRALGSASPPIEIAGDERVQQLGDERIAVNLVSLEKLLHYRKFAKNPRERFRVAGAGRSFTVVFGTFQGIRQQERIETRGRGGAPISDGQAREAFFFRAQMQLGENRGPASPRAAETVTRLAEIGNRFSNNADALFILQRQEKWTEKRAVDAVAKS